MNNLRGMLSMDAVKLVFDAAEACVASSGGDGWCVITCRDHKALAGLFEAYTALKRFPFDRREDYGDNWVNFYRDQEVISFVEYNPNKLVNLGDLDAFIQIPFAVTTSTDPAP